MINLFQPTLGDRELATIREVFESAWLGRGRRTDEFEARFAEHLGAGREHVRSISSCTEGLFLAMELLEIGAGDEVVLPTVHFVGAGNAVASRGARAVFCDVDRRTLNPRVEQIEAAVTERTKAICLLHYGGLPADIAEICELARGRGIKVIEDSACSVSSTVQGQSCGTFGDIGTWSFDAMKILVTGDGGMVYVADRELAARVAGLTYLGLEESSGFSQAASASRWWEFEISSFSRRSIINDVSAAMGLVQLERLAEFIARRREIHRRYDFELAGLDWLETPPSPRDGHESSYYLYWVQLPDQRTRDELASSLLDAGIYTTFRYFPLHWVRRYRSDAVLPEAEDAARRTLNLPLHQALTDAEVEQIVETVRAFEPTAAAQ